MDQCSMCGVEMEDKGPIASNGAKVVHRLKCPNCGNEGVKKIPEEELPHKSEIPY